MVALIVTSSIGLAVWATSIGNLFGWGFVYFPTKVLIGTCVSIADNAVMMYVASRLIFLVTKTNLTSATSYHDLHQCVSRMVVATIIGFAAWVTSIAWLAINPNSGTYIVYHCCNYGFIFSAVVAGLAGGLLNQFRARTATSTGPVRDVSLTVQQPSQTQYNQTFEQQNL